MNKTLIVLVLLIIALEVYCKHSKTKDFSEFRNPMLSLRRSNRPGSKTFIDDAWADWQQRCGTAWQSEDGDDGPRLRWEYKFRKMELDNALDPHYTEIPTCNMHYSAKEFSQKYLGAVPLNENSSPLLSWALKHDIYPDKQNNGSSSFLQTEVTEKAPLPEYVSWHKQIELPVRYQTCGDCWANQGTSALEALYQIIGNNYQQFSVQNSINCAGQAPNQNGCNGGKSINVFNFTQKFGAVAYENSPYFGIYNPGDKCAKNKYYSTNIFFVSGYGQASNSCDDIKAAVSLQPIVVYVYVDSSFEQSGSSIIQDAPGTYNHAVLLMGYTPTYWLIQNSWGTASQYNGFCRVAMGNVRQICTVGYWPTSAQSYKIKPYTQPYNFITHLSVVELSRISFAPVNMNAMIGTKFSIDRMQQNTAYFNSKREVMSQADPAYFFTATAGPRNLKGQFTVNFQFITNKGAPFNFIFDNGPAGNKNGYLVSNNLNNQVFQLGYCDSYDVKANDEGVLQTMCPATSNATQFYIMFNPKNNDYFQLQWYLPSP